jgi:hypothetical protein
MTEKIDISGVRDDDDITGKIISSKDQAQNVSKFINGKVIGISISESDNLLELGFSVTHLRDAMVEIARYLLNSGAILAYGGDTRTGGFSQTLYDLVRLYKMPNESPSASLINFLAWPLSLRVTNETQTSLIDKVTFRKIPPPTDLTIDDSTFLEPVTVPNLLVWAKCLTKMRIEMTRLSDARIFMGGRTTGFKGICPGVLEELLLALSQKKPIYLIGAFGGVTNDCINALQGKRTPSFQFEGYCADSTMYRDFAEEYNRTTSDMKIDYDYFYKTVMNFGLDQLSATNGLSVAENLRLFTTPHFPEIIHLVLKGLNKTFKKRKPD